MFVNWFVIASRNGLLFVQRQAITGTNADLLSIQSRGTNLSKMLIEIQIFSCKKSLNMLSAGLQPFSSGLNVLNDANT